jgi:hypothetical protein
VSTGPTDERALAGRWEKVSTETGAGPYPDLLELGEGGRYRGEMRPGSPHHPLWDLGGWEAAGPGRVRISTANDARVVYDVRVGGDELTFTAPDGCEVAYRRAS